MKELNLPQKGRSREDIMDTLETMKRGDLDWKSGRAFSLIYNAGQEVMDVGREAYSMFRSQNGLSPFAFPSLRTLEMEVIAMTAGILGGDAKVAGNMTTGGTESIFMAVKSARDQAREKKPHIKTPELIKPVTAHPAFNKSAHYLDIKVVEAPVGADFRANVQAMTNAITDNTIFMVGSAMTYPHGIVDPITELAAAAAGRDGWFHVDSCLGGFVLPFVRELGYDVPDFDFRVPGVISMSADLHKYGFVPKSASSVLYRNSSYRFFQYYAYADFPGGVYGTPTLTGGRTGGPYAAAWAVLNFLGREGYLENARLMMETTKKLMAGITAIPGLYVLGKPHASVFAFGGDTLNVYALSDVMNERGWLIEKQQMPPSLHLTVSPFHAQVADAFLEDLAAAAKQVEGIDASNLSREAAMYGMMASMPDRKLAKDLALNYLNDLYRL